ncbi:MAG TPA: cytochrome c oxidase subunit 3 [Bryobacteraceae bacterium]|nr:cytochrome c oxidase subunit 3 [Bryobacteraceae bacterium]
MRFTTAQVAVLIGLVSLTFFFGALVLAFGLRIDAQRTWQRFEVPGLLWLGTALLALSSWTLEASRRSLRTALIAIYRGRLIATILLGIMFLCIQSVAAADLLAQGVGAAANPHGSAFYVFMTIHALHLCGGITWLAVLRYRSAQLFSGTETDLRHQRRSLSAVAIYWHFMGALWLVLYAFLRRWTSG